MNATRITLGLLACTLALLAACGSGSGTLASGVGSGGTGAPASYATGRVTGFGSIVIDGTHYDDSQAQVNVDYDPTAPTAASTASVKLGMRVETQLDAQNRITALRVTPELVGVIEQIASDSLVVARQTVHVSANVAAPTVFEGADSLADLNPGDSVEVHGTRTADGILASRIERRDPSQTGFVRVTGALTTLDAAARRLTLGALVVDFSQAPLSVPMQALAPGQALAVWSDLPLTNGVLTAKRIGLRQPSLATGAALHLNGTLSAVDAASAHFLVNGLPVDAHLAHFDNGSVQDLTTGANVRVEGQWNGNQCEATGVHFVRDPGDAAVQLSGAITDFVSAASFKVRGVTIDASHANFALGGPDNLAEGVFIAVQGAISGDTTQAATLTVSAPPAQGAVRLAGRVTDFSPSSGVFHLTGPNPEALRIDAATRFTNADGSAARSSDLAVGKTLWIRGTRDAAGILSQEVILLPPPHSGKPPPPVRPQGSISDLDTAQHRFTLNGIVVQYGATTRFPPGSASADLRNGRVITVSGTTQGGVLQADAIDFQGPPPPGGVCIHGVVTDFVTLDNLRVAGQRVDAHAARIGGGAASALANGRTVDVKGRIDHGVLRADSLDFAD